MNQPKLTEKKWKKEFEQEITSRWKKDQIYKVEKDSEKEFYVIDTPPPYINAPIHLGHATTYVLQDMFARFRRMMGYEVVFPLGLDRNGLPIEVAAEKKFKVRLHDLDRKEALEYCKKILEMTSTESIKTFSDLGCSFSSWDFDSGEVGQAYMTDSDSYRALTQDTFIDLWNDGLVYFDTRINNYSPGLKTTIADSEIEYAELPTQFVDVEWKVKETGEKIIIGTTRPELIASCGMVIFNPEDERYQHLEGKTAILPIYGTEVPIKAHADAKIEKGSGLVMMCSAGDNTDIRFFREQNIKPIISIDIEGKMKSNTGFLEGLPVKKAREAMIEKLSGFGIVKNIKAMTHKTPICERSKVPIEFIEMEELYVKQLEYIDDLKEISKKISFYDPKSRHFLDDWFEEISIDWPVSRRRFYSTEIPLWYCKSCNKVVVPSTKGQYWQPWKDECPIKRCPDCDNEEWIGETRVFDTWFDSSISALYNLKYLKDETFYNKPKKVLRPQGKEIVRTWLYYSLLRCYHATKKPIFNDVWIHHHVVDKDGKKFSKSLGNGIDPQDIISQYGTESFRLWCVLEGNIHEDDLRCSLERMQGFSKTLNKIWNISRFISTFDYDENSEYELLESDLIILNELNRLITLSKENYLNYDFHNPAKEIRHFIMESFSSHYLELVKSRAYNENGGFSVKEQNGALFTLNEVLRHILRLWAPVIPVVTYKIYGSLYNENIHNLIFPEKLSVKDARMTIEDIEAINSEIWKKKHEMSLSLKDGLSSIQIPTKYECLLSEIKAAHSIKELTLGNDFLFEG